jgi:hypothetical protein
LLLGVAVLGTDLALHSCAQEGSMYSARASSAADIDRRRKGDVGQKKGRDEGGRCGKRRAYFVVNDKCLHRCIVQDTC